MKTPTYIYYRIDDPTKEVLDRNESKTEYIATVKFSERKVLSIPEFNKLFKVEREKK